MKEKIAVYLGAALLAVGLFLAAKLYAKNSQAAQARTRQASVSGGSAENGRRTPVKVWRVFGQELVETLKLPGTVAALHDVDLAARRGGTILWIGPDEGDRVKAGQKLLQLDVEAAAAEAERAEAECELQRARHKRLAGLYEQNVVSPDEYEEAAADLKKAEAALEAAQVDLDYGTLYSPIDGALERMDVDPGEHVAEGQTVMRLVDIDKVEVWLDVPEKDVLYMRTERKARLYTTNGRDLEFEGVVDFLSMTADTASRTYSVKVLVDNPDHLLRPGMIVRAQLVRRDIPQAIAVPFFTILEGERSKRVFVIEDNVARARSIEHDIIQGGMVQIVEGLGIGDQLVVVGQRDLVEGEPVEIAQDITALAQQAVDAGIDLSELAMDLAQKELALP
jgi:membrane fusion protein (multidrug efflux system)